MSRMVTIVDSQGDIAEVEPLTRTVGLTARYTDDMLPKEGVLLCLTRPQSKALRKALKRAERSIR